LALPIALALARSAAPAVPPPATGRGAGAIFDRGVLLATGLNLCGTLAAPSGMAFLPLYARSLGIEHVGLVYVMAGITSIFVRPLLGRKSDSMGRGPAVAIGLSAQLTGYVLIFLADGLTVLVLGGFLASLGWAMIGSTTTALAMDLTDPRSRGRGMATFSISFQVGNG